MFCLHLLIRLGDIAGTTEQEEVEGSSPEEREKGRKREHVERAPIAHALLVLWQLI
jgi:hypothetical protein